MRFHIIRTLRELTILCLHMIDGDYQGVQSHVLEFPGILDV